MPWPPLSYWNKGRLWEVCYIEHTLYTAFNGPLTNRLDAHGDVLRGLQVVESACGIASNLMGEKIEVSRDMDTETRRLPLGVCAR
jgi:hypothetical protein